MMADRNVSSEKLDVENFDHQQAGSQYQIRPSLQQKFRPQEAREAILNVLTDKLSGKVYANEDATYLTKDIAGVIRDTVKGLYDPAKNRFKFMVQVVLGEQRGAGVKIGARCMWDSDADSYASGEYENDSLFCVATVFAVYQY